MRAPFCYVHLEASSQKAQNSIDLPSSIDRNAIAHSSEIDFPSHATLTPRCCRSRTEKQIVSYKLTHDVYVHVLYVCMCDEYECARACAQTTRSRRLPTCSSGALTRAAPHLSPAPPLSLELLVCGVECGAASYRRRRWRRVVAPPVCRPSLFSRERGSFSLRPTPPPSISGSEGGSFSGSGGGATCPKGGRGRR